MIISTFVRILLKNFEIDFIIYNCVDFGLWLFSGLEYRFFFWYRDVVFGIRFFYFVFIIY